MLRRTSLKSRQRREWEAQRASRSERQPKPLHRLERPASFVGTTAGPAPKTTPYRDRALLEMAQRRRCLLMAVEGCEGASGLSTVACHQNEGKGMAQKQSDERSVFGCRPCHEWYDRSGAPRDEKRRAFDAAHIRQIAEWRRIEQDQSEPERFRKAARWALDRIEGGQK